MDWTEVVIETKRTWADVVTNIATRLSDSGLYIEDYADLEEQVWQMAHVDLIEVDLLQKDKDTIRVHLYLSPEDNPAAVTEKAQGLLLAAGVEYRLLINAVRQEDWETAWKQYYHPIAVGRRLLVAPSWEACDPGERTLLRLDPGMAFGTGTHETTTLCLEALDETLQGGESLLDIGTGSGILAVAALLLGAEKALGIDIDPMCVRVAGENAVMNGVQNRFELHCGDLAAKATGRYHVITANIIADAIMRLAPSVPALLRPGGVFIASGIIDTREADALAALHAAGFADVDVRRLNGWVALVARS